MPTFVSALARHFEAVYNRPVILRESHDMNPDILARGRPTGIVAGNNKKR
jgi:hypothetical protein